MTNIPNLRSAPAADVPDGAPVTRHLRLVAGVPRRPDGMLQDLRLKGPVREAVEPLREVGFEPLDGFVTSPVDTLSRKVTVVGRLGTTYYLAELPRRVLVSGREASQGVFALLPHLFPEGSVVYLLGYRVDALPFVLSNMVTREQRRSLCFVPWLHLAGPPKDPPPPEQLRAIFRLDQSLPNDDAGPARQRQAVTAKDRDLVAEQLGELLLHASEPRSRYRDLVRTVVPSPDLQSKAEAYWNSDLRITASSFVEWADYQGPAALGRIVTVLVEDAPGHERVGLLVRLAADCELLAPERLDRLRRTIAATHWDGDL